MNRCRAVAVLVWFGTGIRIRTFAIDRSRTGRVRILTAAEF